VIKPRLLDTKDAASYLGVSETRVREYVKYGKLRSVTLPHPYKSAKDTRKLLIEVSELDAFIDRHKAS
jgi:predicted site-specific integrase-resolvase